MRRPAAEEHALAMIEHTVMELADLADEHDLELLSYLLRMAALEAQRSTPSAGPSLDTSGSSSREKKRSLAN
jgi:hypothetical protein